MGKMMNRFQAAVENVKQQYADKKQREAAEAAWVREQDASKAVCDYFAVFFDKDEAGYRFLKANRQGIHLGVKEEGVELNWFEAHGPAQSFKEMRAIAEGEKKLITFAEIYQWYGGDARNYYGRLDTKAKQLALRDMVIDRVRSHPHIKYSDSTGMITVKMFH